MGGYVDALGESRDGCTRLCPPPLLLQMRPSDPLSSQISVRAFRRRQSVCRTINDLIASHLGAYNMTRLDLRNYPYTRSAGPPR
jgi:hypothetical protein